MKTEKITLIAALFLNKFDKELQRIVNEDIKVLKEKMSRPSTLNHVA